MAVDITSLGAGRFTKSTNKLKFQLPAFYSSANEECKTAAGIVTGINEFSSSANATCVDVNAQQCFAFTGAIKGSLFTVRSEDAECQACTLTNRTLQKIRLCASWGGAAAGRTSHAPHCEPSLSSHCEALAGWTSL